MESTQNNEKISVQKRNTEGIKPHQFKKGQSGNPGGRPRKITSKIEKFLAKRAKGEGRNRSNLDVFAETGVMRAIVKSDALFKEIYDRVEGPVPKEISGNNGQPIKIEYVSQLGAPPSPVKPKSDS
jgi:hypothetical protein